MNRAETAQLLALCAAFDRRTVGRSDVIAWAEVLTHVTFDEAAEAVKRHYASETAWVMPAHITRAVGRIRRERLELVPEISEPDADPDDVPAYLHALRTGKYRVAGQRARRAIDYRRTFRRIEGGGAS